jgi:enoyl-CoA hydratase
MNGTLHLSLEGAIATITLDRPDARNALNLEMCQDLLEAAATLQKHEPIRVLFLRGAGPAFCAGADLKERADKTKDWVRERRMKAFAAYDALEALPFPVISVVHGAAMGAGVEMCTVSDFVVATPEAFFGTPEAQRGTIGATQRLAKIIGRGLAKDMMYTGRRLTAEEARQAGLVARIVPKEKLEDELQAIGKVIAAVPVLAMRQAKRCITGAFETDRRGALALEMEAIDEQLAAGTWLGKK